MSVLAGSCVATLLCVCGALGFVAGRAVTHRVTQSADYACPGRQEALVTGVIDGDTIEIAGGERVRYIGIDAPETDECYGREATEMNRQLVEGKQVILICDVTDRGKYGRLLRYVIADGRFVNAELVRLGCANAQSYGENVMFQQVLTVFERDAREADLGLWKECTAR